MTEEECEEKKKRRHNEVVAMDAFMENWARAAQVREEREIELLEQISNQLDSIEGLLRAKLGVQE